MSALTSERHDAPGGLVLLRDIVSVEGSAGGSENYRERSSVSIPRRCTLRVVSKGAHEIIEE